jgi:GNAT superfamily N-acetyltransferase
VSRLKDTLFCVHESDEDGVIGWRWGTGDNVELTHLRATQNRNGHGRRLLVGMLLALRAEPPYCTVFGFTRTGNLVAQEFYRAMGFTLTPVAGVYADGAAVLFSARYDDLCRLHLPPREPPE